MRGRYPLGLRRAGQTLRQLPVEWRDGIRWRNAQEFFRPPPYSASGREREACISVRSPGGGASGCRSRRATAGSFHRVTSHAGGSLPAPGRADLSAGSPRRGLFFLRGSRPCRPQRRTGLAQVEFDTRPPFLVDDRLRARTYAVRLEGEHAVVASTGWVMERRGRQLRPRASVSKARRSPVTPSPGCPAARSSVRADLGGRKPSRAVLRSGRGSAGTRRTGTSTPRARDEG